MTENSQGGYEQNQGDRIERLEGVLKLDERLKELEDGVTKGKESKDEGRRWGPKQLTAIAALLAVVAPVSTAVYSGVTGYMNIRTERVALEHQIAIDYLDRIIDSDLPPADRQRYLRYVAAAVASTGLSAWAQMELEGADQDVNTGDLLAESERTQLAVGSEIIALRRLLSDVTALSEAEIDSLKFRVEELSKERLAATINAADLSRQQREPEKSLATQATSASMFRSFVGLSAGSTLADVEELYGATVFEEIDSSGTGILEYFDTDDQHFDVFVEGGEVEGIHLSGLNVADAIKSFDVDDSKLRFIGATAEEIFDELGKPTDDLFGDFYSYEFPGGRVEFGCWSNVCDEISVSWFLSETFSAGR